MRGTDTIVETTANCDIHLDGFGFYVTCRACPHVSEYTHAKHRARQWAEAHDNDEPGRADHREN